MNHECPPDFDLATYERIESGCRQIAKAKPLCLPCHRERNAACEHFEKRLYGELIPGAIVEARAFFWLGLPYPTPIVTKGGQFYDIEVRGYKVEIKPARPEWWCAENNRIPDIILVTGDKGPVSWLDKTQVKILYETSVAVGRQRKMRKELAGPFKSLLDCPLSKQLSLLF